MAKQTINVGTVANDGTGDNLRAAWIKQNAMNAELYTTLDALVVSQSVVRPAKDTS